MANTIKIKNSGTASNTPSANSLEYGELAINYVDGKLYFKNTASTVNFFSAGAGGGASTLDDLTDVAITSAEEFQGLSYNGTSWVNSHIPLVSYVQNAEANTITTGTCVYLFGSTGDHASVKRADNSSDTTSSKTIGVVGANIAASNNGPVVTRGYVDGIDLSVGYTAGDILWLGENGAFTTTKPTAPDHLVFIGVVVRATNNGIVYVATQNGYELDELHNVSLPSPQAGEFLKYNGSLWVSDVIDLGTDTTGNYMSNVSAGTGISITHTPSEGSTATIAVDTSYSGFVPTGTVFQYSGNTAPSGYLICDGAAISRTTYATLFGVIGTRYGVGDGATTFNLPSMASKVPQGITTGVPSGTTITTSAESATHTHTITTGIQSANHTHNGTSGGVSAGHNHTISTSNANANHSHNQNWTVGTGNDNNNHTHGYQKSNGSNAAATSDGVSTGHTHTWNANLTTAGDGAAHSHGANAGSQNSDHTHNTTVSIQSADHTHSGTTANASVVHNHLFDIVQFVYIIKI